MSTSARRPATKRPVDGRPPMYHVFRNEREAPGPVTAEAVADYLAEKRWAPGSTRRTRRYAACPSLPMVAICASSRRMDDTTALTTEAGAAPGRALAAGEGAAKNHLRNGPEMGDASATVQAGQSAA